MAVEIIYKYFPELTSDQKSQFEKLDDIYNHWNAKVNVVSRKDMDQLYERHVLHSLAIGKFIDFAPGTEIMDVGTGGGFPGLPLAILFPDCHFHCVDSIGKKITVVQEIASAIALKNLTTAHERMEKVNGSFDFVISRAVAPSKQLFQWTHQKIKKDQKNKIDNGMILLKGGDLVQELKMLGKRYVLKQLSDFFLEDFFLTKKVIYVPAH